MTGSVGPRAGQVYAVLAAVLTGILLFLPILLVGLRFYAVAVVAQGDGLGWQFGVAMTYVFIGIPAFIQSRMVDLLNCVCSRKARTARRPTRQVALAQASVAQRRFPPL